MAEIDWTAVIVALVGGGGTLTAAIGIWAQRRKYSPDRAAEDRAAEDTSTPVSPGTGSHNVEAIRLAQQAMTQVTGLSEKLAVTEERLGEVERELGLVRRSYQRLYRWAEWLYFDWERLSEHPDPPPLPDDLHHVN